MTDSGQRPLPKPVIGQRSAPLLLKDFIFNALDFPIFNLATDSGERELTVNIACPLTLLVFDQAAPFVTDAGKNVSKPRLKM